MRKLNRRVNLALLATLVVGLALFGGGLHLVHGIQVRRNASALLDRARRAEADKQPAKAEEALGWYLSLRPDDPETWGWYARVVDREGPDSGGVERAFLVHEQALSHAPGDRALKRRCAELAIELSRHGDARALLTELLVEVPADTIAAERAELEDLLGQCEGALAHHDQASAWLRAAIGHDPHRVDAYGRLARLLRTELRKGDVADDTIAEMMAKNPQSGRACAYRWRYAEQFAPPANDKDIARALELAPDDREVLLAAAMASEQKHDMAAMRAQLEKGCRLDPKDLSFALHLSRLETREGHLDRAEAVLRRAFAARPIVGLVFALADTLILQGKIDGEDGAAARIAVLRRAGLGETFVRFLEAEVLFHRKMWTEAIAELEAARAVLASEPELSLRINLMLAESHGRLGSDEQRLDALRRAAEGKQGGDPARLELVQALAQAGQLDRAISTFSPLAVAGNNPEWRLDLVRLMLAKVVRQPRDRRNWQELEGHLREAEKAAPGAAELVVLLRVDILVAQDRLDEARTLLGRSLEKMPNNLRFRLAMARVAQLQHPDDGALRIIDQAEKELGPSPLIDLARLDYWGRRGGDAARGAVARLAAARGQIPAADRITFLERLGAVALRLGRPDLARQYWRELADLQADDIRIRLGLFDLAVEAGDRDEPSRLIEEIRKIEGEVGTNWRFARAALLLDQARRGYSEGLDEARRLIADIAERRPRWWVGPTLNGQIAELTGSPDQAISYYLQALELGNVQPSLARRLVTLLDQQGRRADVDRVTQALGDQGAALAVVAIVQALDALRDGDRDRGLAMARQVFPESSPNAADHLNLGRIYKVAGRTSEAGEEFRRAVELGPGSPENWLAYVQYLAQLKRLEQARAVMEAASKALPPDRATLALAQCALAIGDADGAESLIKQAMGAEGRADDLAALRVAVNVSLRLNRLEAAHSYLDRIAGLPSASPADRAWANRTRAELLLATNRPADRAQALGLVDRNLAYAPESAEDQSLKATILALRPAGRGMAIAILERLAGTNRLEDKQRFFLAQLHLAQGEEAKYEGEMLRLLNRKGQNPGHLAHFVNYWIDRNRPDQADRWLAELKQADPRGLPALELEARLLDLRKRRPELLALLGARVREVPEQIGPAAALLSRFGFAKEAEAANRALIARTPGRPEGRLALAVFLAGHGRHREAVRVLGEAWSTGSHGAVAMAGLVIYTSPSAEESQKQAAVRWLIAAAAETPDDPDLATTLGAVLITEGRSDEAETTNRRVLARDPDNATALNNLAWLLALRDGGGGREALTLIDRAIEANGANPAALDTRAVALIRTGQGERAIGELRNAQDQEPRNPDFPLHLAWAYQSVGRTDEARSSLRRAEELGLRGDGKDPLERRFIAQLRRDLAGVNPSARINGRY